MKYFFVHLMCLLFFVNTLTAQQTKAYTHQLADYQHAVTLYENKNYKAAQQLFQRVMKSPVQERVKADCAYYIANTAIRLNEPNADTLMEDFVNDYPLSTKRNSAYLDVGNYYFKIGKYPQAQKWYDQADTSGLTSADEEELTFKKGYIAFKTGNTEKATTLFNRITTSQEYGSQAKYYLGYMAYEGDDYEEAGAHFEEVDQNSAYSEKLSYYRADMNFKLGNFEEAIALGKEQFAKSNRDEKSQLSKIIGESYFNLGEYAAAIPYLKEYKGTRGKWNNTDYYQLGYAYYKQGDYQNAIAEFNKIVSGKNEVAQNAYYHLAEAYLKLDKKQQALNAFKNASEMSFNNLIQEDAFYNYAKLSYDIGNPYESVPQVFLNYLESYPDTQYQNEMEALLVDSYLTSKNFKEALELLDKNKGIASDEVYQKVAFYRGLELAEEQNFSAAKDHFEKAMQYPDDSNIHARVVYWTAESNFQLGNYEAAIAGFKKAQQITVEFPESQHVSYSLGYAYFRSKQYESAISAFESYLAQPSPETNRKKDAYLRLADSYFVTSAYWPAMENYNEVIAMGGLHSDYASFQKAISYGFVDRVPQKIENLEGFIAKYVNSAYHDDALFELGNTYVSQNSTGKALISYDKLIKTYPQSSFVPKALLRKGLIFYNTGENTKALSMFKRVANDFPSSPESVQAVGTAKLIYIDQGNVDDYATWVKTLDFVEIADAELDEAAYQAAETPYLENRNEIAIQRFEKYINDFPNGIYSLNANFYLAQLYFNADEKDKSLPHYEFVISKEQNEFTETALYRVALLRLEKQQYKEAVPVLKRLEDRAASTQNRTFAQSNLMKSYYEMEQYDQAATYAEKVIEDNTSEQRAKSDAYVIVARTAVKTGDMEKARNAYAEVQKTATGRLAAEALYYDAFFKNKEGNYAKSNEAVQQLAKDFSGYKEFSAKGLVLMAKNFYALDDAYQATYILESVIQNFTDYPEVVSEAEDELTSIKAQEAKTNASVEAEEE